MAKFIVRAHIQPDAETGPGEPDPGMEGKEMAAAMGGPRGMMAAKKPAQFTLPPSGGKKAPPKKKGPPSGKNNG